MSPSLDVGALAATTVLIAVAPGRRPPPRVDGLVALAGSGHGQRRRPVTWSRSWLAGIDRAVTVLGHRARRVAGRPPSPSHDRRAGALLLVGLVSALVQPVAAVPAVALVGVVAARVERSRRQQRRERFLDDVPDVIELFHLAIGAGLTIHQAVEAVQARATGDLGAVLGGIRSEVAAGHRLGDALDHVGVADEALRPLTSALAGAERYGAPVGPTLDRLADDARRQRRRRAEELARRLPVQLLFPLVLCVLPAFALLTVAPLVLAALDGLPR